MDEETGIDGIELFISVEDLANKMYSTIGFDHFLVISTPMSLNMIRDSIQQKKYSSIHVMLPFSRYHDHDELFWRDVELICQNVFFLLLFQSLV